MIVRQPDENRVTRHDAYMFTSNSSRATSCAFPMKSLTSLVAAALLFSLSATQASAADQPTKLFIAQGAISNDVTPMWLAKDRGIFRKYGLEIDNVFIIAG